MSPRFPRVVTLFWLGLVAACGSNPIQFRPLPESQHGTYRFSSHVSRASPIFTVEGTFTVMADTVMASVAGETCRPTVPPLDTVYAVQCGAVRLEFDRRDPVRRSSYTALGSAIVQERVCKQVTWDRFGVQRCAEYRTERVPREQSFHGVLRPVRQQ